jgi:hypothetical protein
VRKVESEEQAKVRTLEPKKSPSVVQGQALITS